MTSGTVPPQSTAPQSPELVVTRQVLLALGAAARGEVPQEFRAELTDRGLLRPGGRVADEVAATAAAVGSPLATLRVTAVGAAGTRGADVWVGAHRAVLHPAGEGPSAVVSVSRSLLPQLLVRAAGLVPRPRSGQPAFLAGAAEVAAACRGTATGPWPGAVERPSLWRVSWRATAGESGDLAVLDLGPLGLWRPESGQGAELAWSPVTSATVWEGLGRLFAATLEDRPAA